MKKVWDYLKEKKLQDPKDKQWFTPDQTMAPVFGNEKISGFGMLRYLQKHLTNPGGSSPSCSLDLECPVCTETVRPPMRLKQCGQVGTKYHKFIINFSHLFAGPHSL